MSSKDRDAHHLALSPEALRLVVSRFHDQYRPGEEGHMDPIEVEWTYEPRFPLNEIGSPEEWQSFMKEEIQAWVESGERTRFSDMIHRPIQDPVILLVRGGKVYAWDVMHRIGACALSGRKSVPAIVGRPIVKLELVLEEAVQPPARVRRPS